MKHMAIRRVELFTIRRFIETRRARGPLTPDIMARIEKGVNETTLTRYPALPAGFSKQLAAEFTALKSVWTAAK
jgi:hypothetical protein